MSRIKVKTPTYVLVLAVVLGGLYWYASSHHMLDKGKNIIGTAVSESDMKDDNTIKIGVVTWPGYAGGEYFNGGFEPTQESRFKKEYGLNVKFIKLDDFGPSREAWKHGDVDLLWATADAFSTESGSLPDNPKIVFQADWSRGGDAIVARPGINSVNDLKANGGAKKKIAVAYGTPSHTFLLNVLTAAQIGFDEVELKEVQSATDAATMFKTQKIDAAVVWSPDDEACVQAFSGSKILTSTKEATHIISDVFFAKDKWVGSHKDQLTKLITGWMRGNSEINSNTDGARDKAAKILADGLGQDLTLMKSGLTKVRLTTYGDNLNFFGLNPSYTDVKGSDLYTRNARYYEALKLASNVPAWEQISDPSALKAVSLANSGDNIAEGEKQFDAPSPIDAIKPSLATTRLVINFPSGSATLDQSAKQQIEEHFGQTAELFGGMRVRVEGNTDNVGSSVINTPLSKKRAQSVADYMVTKYHFNRNRFVVLGKGSDNPVADNLTDDGRRKNRRTDLELLSE